MMQLLIRIAVLWGFVVLGSMVVLMGYVTSKEEDPALWFLFALLAISVTLLAALFIVVWKEGKG
jgi:hypothetical protein